MQPGLWEVTATVEVAGLNGALPPTTQTECLTQKDVDSDPVPEFDKAACRASDVHRSGGKITWVVVCSGALTGKGRGEIQYRSATAYDGAMTLETEGMVLRTTLRARRIGGC